MENISVSERYSILKLIGRGSFGVIFKVLDKTTNKEVALKIIRNSSLVQEIYNEIDILSKLQGGKGIPTLYWYPKERNYYTMELLGPCIYDKFIKQHNFLSKSNLFIIADQLLDRLEYIHSKSILHRDLKTQQLLLGGHKNRSLYLIDFGLSKKYRKSDGSHAPYVEGRPFTGTFNYASLNTHLGVQQSRRDDLESYCYILAFLYTGDLPWKLNKSTHNKVDIQRMKTIIKPSGLFAENIPLGKIFTYTRSLMYNEEPNYMYIHSLLLEFRGDTKDIYKYLRWNSGKYRSASTACIKVKKVKKTKKCMSKKSMVIIKVQSAPEEMSVTVVCAHYPEFQPRNSPQKIITKQDIPESRTPNARPEKTCVVF